MAAEPARASPFACSSGNTKGENAMISVTRTISLLIFTGSIFAGTAASAADPLLLRGAHTVPEKEAQAYTWREFKACIEKESNGRVKMDVYPAAQMGSDLELVDKVAMGALHMGHASTSNLAAIFKEFEAIELPFMVEKTDDNLKLFYRGRRLAGPASEHLQKKFAEKNLRMFWMNPLLVRMIHNSKRPLKVPEDMKGLKVRVTASKIERDDILAFGSNPVAMGYGEVYTALAQGTIDGMGVPINAIPAANAWETLKYTTLVPFNGFFVPAFINKKFYEGLAGDVREQMDECAYKAIEYSIGLWKKLDDEAIPLMKQHGMQIYQPNEKEYASWKAALKGVYDKYAAGMDKNWMSLLEQAKAGK
jgi:TRAP-type C4-dicarboxylate transport system substrate-binding protein